MPEPLQHLKPRLPRIAAAILGSLIAAQALALWHEWPARSGAGASAGQPALVPPSRSPDVGAITRAALFGRAPQAAGSLDPASAREGHEGYALKGIMALEGLDDGFAIIAGPDGKSRVLRKGESLGEKLTVAGIWTDYVLLVGGDTPERLTLPRGLLGSDPRPRRMLAVRAPERAAPARTISDGTQSTLRYYGLNAIGDPQGQITGLAGRGSPGWAHSGLLPTDVITAIDGKSVDEVLKTPHAIDEATVAAVTVLTVERDGVQMQIEASPYDAPPPLSAAQRRRNRG